MIRTIKDLHVRKSTTLNGRTIDDDIKNRLKENHDYIQMVGRPVGSIKDPKRRKVTNPNGRIIDYGGLQYNKFIRSGYKLNDAGTHLVADNSVTGSIVKRFAGRPRGKASSVPDSQKIKNPETGRLIKKNAYTFKQLIKKYFYDETKNELITTIFDPKQKNNISLNSLEFKKRIKHVYIYNKLNKTNKKTSKKNEKALKEDIMITQNFHISEKMVAITNIGEIDGAVLSMNEGIHRRIDRFTVGGSGWRVEEIARHYITIAKYKPLTARSYISL